MATAIIGTGNIGGTLARLLDGGGEPVVLAAKDEATQQRSRRSSVSSRAPPRSKRRSPTPTPSSSPSGSTRPRSCSQRTRACSRTRSSSIRRTRSGSTRRPDDPDTARRTVGRLDRRRPAPRRRALCQGVRHARRGRACSGANREPRRAVLFYATDDDTAATTIERLIRAAGFEPLKAGGVADAGRIEMPGGDLHQFGLNGALLDLDQARAVVSAEVSA